MSANGGKILVEILAGDLRTRMELVRLVQAAGFEPVPAASPADLLEARARQAGSALLLAEPSPGAGVEWLAQVAAGIPTVVVLSEATASRALDCLRAGAVDCLPPSPTKESVTLALRRALSGLRPTALFDEEVPAPDRPRSRKLAIAGALLAVAVSVVAFRQMRGSGPAPTALPYAHPAGLAWTGAAFWVADWYGESLNEHDASFALVRTRPFPAEQPLAVAWGEGLLWVAAAGGTISARRPDAGLSEARRARVQGLAPSGLCHDGLYLWAADSRSREFVRFLTDAALSEFGRYAYAGGRPDAIACDADGLWSYDGESGEVLRHALEEPARVLARRHAGLGADVRVTGLARSGRALWVVGEAGEGAGRAWRLELP